MDDKQHEKFKKQANLERDERTAKRAILLKNITGASQTNQIARTSLIEFYIVTQTDNILSDLRAI